MKKDYIICSRCVMDTTDPLIKFDEKGECQYCKMHDNVEMANPTGEIGKSRFEEIVERIKKSGKNKRYDCIAGVSGGTDSSYSLYLAVKFGLRPLAVHFDNGWNTEIAVQNIRNLTEKLGVDLYTYVVDWEEFKDIQLSFLKASVPDIEIPSDQGINATLFKVAAQEKIKFILHGHSFRTEGKVPLMWSYGDGKYLLKVHKRFSKKRIKSLPNYTLRDMFYYNFIKRIQKIRILYYFDYNKEAVKELLKNNFDWQYYGGHHYENIYTRFYQGYILPVKFGFDKRKRELSALMRSGVIDRIQALEVLKQPAIDPELAKSDMDYVIKKLGITKKEFNEIMKTPPKTFLDYPSHFKTIMKYKKTIKFFYKFISPTVPLILDDNISNIKK